MSPTGPASVSNLLFKNSCVPDNERLVLTAKRFKRTSDETEYRQMYLLFPPASTQVPSALYRMVLKLLVPAAFAAVRRSLILRPPDTSLRPSTPDCCSASDTDQNVSWPSSVDTASCN